MLYLLQQLLNGIHAGALYALLAFGYALTNGVLRRTNLAFGALFAFAGQAMILVAVFGWQVLWLTLPATVALGVVAAFALSALVSQTLARNLFLPLRDRSPNAIVVATLGVSLVLMEAMRIAADTRDLWLPPMLNRPVTFAAADGYRATLTAVQLGNVAIALLAILLLGLWLRRSPFGRAWRALCDDPAAASFCGIDVARTTIQTIVLGGLVAALCGVLAAFHYGNIAFGTGLFFGLKILFLTAVGGYDTPTRAALGAWAFGIAEALWTGYFTEEWRDGWMFAALVAMLVLTRAGDEARRPG